MTATTRGRRTVPPCPPWCDLPPGHPVVDGPVGSGDTADRLRDLLAVLEELGLLVDRTAPTQAADA